MIITSKADGCINAPCATIPSTFVTIVPGTSEIDDVQWADARAAAMRFIENETLKEEFHKVDYKDILVKKGEALDGSDDELSYPKELVFASENEKEKDKRLVPAKLANIDRKGGKVGSGGKVISLVKNTFHPETLNNWYDTEERQDVRLEIFKQKEGVEKGTIKG